MAEYCASGTSPCPALYFFRIWYLLSRQCVCVSVSMLLYPRSLLPTPALSISLMFYCSSYFRSFFQIFYNFFQCSLPKSRLGVYLKMSCRAQCSPNYRRQPTHQPVTKNCDSLQARSQLFTRGVIFSQYRLQGRHKFMQGHIFLIDSRTPQVYTGVIFFQTKSRGRYKFTRGGSYLSNTEGATSTVHKALSTYSIV